jgi:ankyrin repeat protein
LGASATSRIHDAAAAAAALDQVIGLGADLEARDKLGQTPIFGYACLSSLASLQRLIGYGAWVDVCDDLSSTNPTTSSCPRHVDDHLECLEILVEEGGGCINAKDDDGFTPLHWLGRKRDLPQPRLDAALDLLVKLGADLEARSDFDDLPPIFTYACASSLASLQRLLGHGASLDASSNHCPSPLAVACYSQRRLDRKDVILELLQRSSRATRCAVDDNGDSAIDDLVESVDGALFEPWQKQVIAELLRSGVSAKSRNASYVLPIAVSVMCEQDEQAAQREVGRDAGIVGLVSELRHLQKEKDEQRKRLAKIEELEAAVGARGQEVKEKNEEGEKKKMMMEKKNSKKKSGDKRDGAGRQ